MENLNQLIKDIKNINRFNKEKLVLLLDKYDFLADKSMRWIDLAKNANLVLENALIKQIQKIIENQKLSFLEEILIALQEKQISLNEAVKALEIIIRKLEFLKWVSNNKKVASYCDRTLKFSDGALIYSYWRHNKDELYKFSSLEENKLAYPDAYQIIDAVYSKEWKIEEYLTWVNTHNRLITQSKEDKKIVFYDKSPMYTYWYNRYEEIYNEITKPDMQEKYPVAYEVIKKEYQKFTSRNAKRKKTNKIEEYFAWVEKHGRLVKTNENNILFSDGLYMNGYYQNYREKLYLEALKESMQLKYPQATKIIIQTHQNYYNAKIADKINEYIIWVNEHARLVCTTQRNVTFSDGTSMVPYWRNNYQKLYEEVSKEEIKSIYPVAYKIITKNYLEIINTKNQDNISKLEEYIVWVNEHGRLVSQIPEDKYLKFKDNKKMYIFWRNNYQNLYDLVTSKEYSQKYPVAYEVIVNAYLDMSKTKKTKLTFINRINEYLIWVNEHGRLVLISEKNITFSNGQFMNHFWYDNYEKIYAETIKEENIKKYPEAFIIIKKAYLKRKKELLPPESSFTKYFEILNTDGLVALHNAKIFTFLKEHYDVIKEEIIKAKNQRKYPTAYDMIINKYPAFLETKIHKDNRGICLLCVENNVDVNKNLRIINHITYEEFLSKLTFLKENNLSITNPNGILSEIFMMSSYNMKVKYGFTLSELISMYVEKGLKKD